MPASLIEAFRFCKDFAKEKRNLSVERIAELMGVTADALYKWLATGRMPANLIPAYEHICGIDFVSRHLAASSGRMVVDMPTGRLVHATDVQELQALLNDAVGAILAVAAGTSGIPEALADIEAGMGALAWHRSNIKKSGQPELELDQ
ncbi:MAG: hypothetical protein Q7U97_14535 [Rhodocyclaceae bacterium]|nr:hypothetical protein [Rhodocyclaceae bacterium]